VSYLEAAEILAARDPVLARLIEDGQAFHGLRFEGKRFDCGDKLGFLEATVALGLEHPELGPGLRRILAAYL